VSDRVTNPVVIITGAGGGLGRAMAHRLSRDGFRCVLAGRHADSLRRTVEGIATGAPHLRVFPCDIREPDGRDRLIDCALDIDGTLYGLVNNAGVGRLRPLLEESVKDWRDTMETNVEAAFFLAQRVIEHMRIRQEGRIVNIASMHGIVGMNNLGQENRAPQTSPGDLGPVRCSAYTTSKGALVQLTRDLAAAVGRWGITVNAVSPGNIPHPEYPDSSSGQTNAGSEPKLGDKVDQETLDALALQTPLRRLGRVEEIAGSVRFLLSEDAGYITGANLVVDGGFTIW
jgi:NAD(P)-dependent dehydrogenase (short-subunit alcohol dehydrogenase family)